MSNQGFYSRFTAALSGRGHTRTARAVDFIAERYLLLPAGALLALIWANARPDSYFRFSTSSAFVVNEVLMAFFLALIAQEILEAVLPGGALHSWRRWVVPVAAAAGGFAGAGLVYVSYVGLSYQPLLEPAWPVACAIDLVAGYYLVKAIFGRGSAVPFILIVGIVTNAIALMVVALRYDPVDIKPGAGALLIAALALAYVFRRMKVRAFWPYFVVCGSMSWLAFYWGALHPALSLVPIVPFLPHEARRLDLLEDNPPTSPDLIRTAEHEWTYAVQVIVFCFGLVNAGVLLHGYGTGTWAVMTASLAGRPIGILLATFAVVAAGLHLPLQLRSRDLVVVALATSSGFTTALFMAVAAFPAGPVLAEITLGALFSVVGVAVTVAAARMLRVGCFAGAQAHSERPHHRVGPRHAHA
jgi:Na+:H+ antiporter, NhaA family